TSATSPKPARAHVFEARCKGLVNTRAKENRRSRPPSSRARASPRSFSGRSVRPVRCRESVQAVSPCRARNSLGKSVGIIDLQSLFRLSARVPVRSSGITTELHAISGPANRFPRPQIQPLVPVVDRQPVALFQVVRHAVGLDLDGEELTADRQVE